MQKKKEKDAQEETKRDLEFSQQLQKQQQKEDEAKAAAAAAKRKKDEDEEEDPLDAYMKQITKRPQRAGAVIEKVIKTESGDEKQEKKKVVNVVMGVVSSTPSSTLSNKGASSGVKEKGAIMEQDIDGLEYGSDEEEPLDAMGMLNEDILMSGLTADGQPKVKTKSEMVFTDHERVYYRPFRKNFYVEVPEINLMSNEDVELYRLELEGIKCKGKNCPKPIKMWAQCGVSFKVMECLKR